MGLSEALGVGGEITYKGQVYRLAPMSTLGVRARYVKYVRAETLALIQEQKESNPEGYDDLMKAFSRDLALKEYSWGRPTIIKSLMDPENQVRLVFYMLNAHDPKVTLALAQEIYDTERAQLDAAMENDDPNSSPSKTS